MPDFVYETQDRVAWLRLSRPAQGNRITPALDQELAAACQAVGEDDGVEIGVLTGSGNVFCQGLTQATNTAQEIRAQFGAVQCVAALASITKPTIAALNGNAFGLGLELALACDLRLAMSTAQFSLPQIAENLIPFGGGTQRLPRIVGQAKALEMILIGKQIDAQEAHRIGLVNEVIAEDDFSTRVDEALSGLLGKGPIALRLGKEAVHKAMDLTLDQGVRLEEDLYALLQTTQDRAEGVESFLAKRKPRFTGR